MTDERKHEIVPTMAEPSEYAKAFQDMITHGCSFMKDGMRRTEKYLWEPIPLHPDTEALVQRFAEAMRNKLAKAERKYGYSNLWKNDDWLDECRAKLIDHLHKGDPLDVANYCAFLWHHGEHCKPEEQEFANDVLEVLAENAALKAELELMKREVRMKADENQAIYGQLAAAQKDAFRAGMLAAAEMERSKGK
jgi:Lon protease-like protein